MKKIILGMVLVISSLSFSNESNSGKLNYLDDLKFGNETQQSKNELDNTEQIKISNIFGNKKH